MRAGTGRIYGVVSDQEDYRKGGRVFQVEEPICAEA